MQIMNSRPPDQAALRSLTPHPDPLEASAVARIQQRLLILLVVIQILGGIGMAIGLAVGALLLSELAGRDWVAGLGASVSIVGGALLAIPATHLMQARGRRPGMVLVYLMGALGAVIVVTATLTDSAILALAGLFLFGGGSAANLQARYTAVDLVEPSRRGRHLALVVWAATIGAVAGPNLSSAAGNLASSFNAPEMAGPFGISTVVFLVAAVVIWALMRPDPLLLARRRVSALAADTSTAFDPSRGEKTDNGTSERPTGSVRRTPRAFRYAARQVRANPAARLGIGAVAVGHAVMVAVMAMTPVHIDHVMHHHDQTVVLQVVGVVLSLHIAGMYAFSPIVGWATDRWGSRQIILVGVGFLLAACGFSATSGSNTVRLTIGLTLLGLGWSCTMVAGSTLLTSAVEVQIRPIVQGLSDVAMGFAGAVASGLSGFVVQGAGYPELSVVAALIAVPLIAAIVRTTRITSTE